jgi:nucleotide-binding universal stress UspA family protein
VNGRIVVGVDGSESSRIALRWAADEARRRQADLDVVYSWHHPYETFVPMWGLPPWSELEGEALATLESLLADEGLSSSGVPATNAILVQGPAAPALLSASAGADLLVVGSRGHGAFTGMLLGSVSQHCVTHATCPVTVVPGGGPP